MYTVLHLNLRLEESQYISQIRQVPGYDYIHLLREPKYMVDVSLLNDKVYYLNEIFSPKRYAKQNKLKLIHAHHAQLGMVMLPFKEQTHLPMVTSIRGRDATLADQPEDYLENLQFLFDQSNRLFPVCQYLADQINLLGCPAEKIRVLYGGIDLQKFAYRIPPNRNSINIVSIGRLIEKKGHHILIEAFHKIRDKFPQATLTIIGRGPLRNYFESLATQFNLGDTFRILDFLRSDQMYREMYKADIFCAASLVASNGDVEGIPNTLKQAMATGLPVISTFHAGIPELVTPNQDGLLVRENDVDQLAEALEFMLSSRNQWETFSRNARLKVETKFEFYQQLKQQASYYNELIGGD